jgi:putative transposase
MAGATRRLAPATLPDAPTSLFSRSSTVVRSSHGEPGTVSLVRPILPGRVYLLTRRCSQRQFLLRPDEKTNRAFLYCLAEAAERFQIELIGWLAMSNHYHAVVRDPHGRLPDFACHFHQMLAKCLNVRWRRWENFWSTEPPTYTRLVQTSDIFGKLLYTLLNPVEDHLVDSVAHWPGASSWSLLGGRALSVERPRFFFRAGGKMPRSVLLRTIAPDGGPSAGPSWTARVRVAVLEREAQLRASRLSAGARVLGRKGVRATSPFEQPRTPAPRRQLRPFVACRDSWARVFELQALTRFRVEYAKARARFVAGEREVAFPAGTFALQRLGARCRQPS